ncbi:hypothetical protein MVEN_01105900 [Mycena venus]|uniref:Uncharacterized protein n=1 Tax=Mycena venus TaxID=2733690 RepID=A0A8H6Y7Q0_9AGAR|nr:hypothetical protein MVEN_01105900 [Mycena venus]
MGGVDLLFGPMLIGVLLNMMLYGAVVTQMMYLLLAQTANVVIQCGILYEPLITSYGSEAAVTISPKLLPADPFLISIVSAPVQLFAAWRIKVITGSFILPGLIGLLSLVSFGSGINMAIKVFLFPDFRQFDSFAESAIIWLASSAVCDIIIAVGTTYTLYTRKTGFYCRRRADQSDYTAGRRNRDSHSPDGRGGCVAFHCLSGNKDELHRGFSALGCLYVFNPCDAKLASKNKNKRCR